MKTQLKQNKKCLIYDGNDAPYCNKCFNCTSEQPDLETIDNILESLINFIIWEQNQDWKEGYDRQSNRDNEKMIARSDITQLIKEIIGKNEKIVTIPDMYPAPVEFSNGYGRGLVTGRNNLRIEQRQTLRELRKK